MTITLICVVMSPHDDECLLSDPSTAHLGFTSPEIVCPAARRMRTARSASWLRTSTKSVSYVETAKMLMPAVARAVANPANTPVMLRSNGPRTANIDHGPSVLTPAGTPPMSHTAESSAGVRVTEKNVPCITQSGIESSGGKRHIANEPGTLSSVSLGPESVTGINRL